MITCIHYEFYEEMIFIKKKILTTKKYITFTLYRGNFKVFWGNFTPILQFVY